MKKVISFGGYHATGGSVIRDLFKEYQEINLFPTEFRILIERKGLIDLEETLFNNGGCENIDLAIKDFLWICNHFARKTTKFTRKGLNYDLYTKNSFSRYTKEFIDEIIDYKYNMNWHYYDFQKSYYKSQLERYLTKIIGSNLFEKEAFMSYPEFDKFKKSAKKYLNKVLDSFIIYDKHNLENNHEQVFALHNAIHPIHFNLLDKCKAYFDKLSFIIVDRDPRDVFCDFPKNRYIPKNSSTIEKAKAFSDFYLNLRRDQKKIISREDVLFLKFEDIILDYESQVCKINNFIGINKSYSDLKKEFFNPKKSIENIGKFKKLPKEMLPAINYIEKKLSDFLYI